MKKQPKETKRKTKLRRAQDVVKPGEFYEDCAFHPCLCIYSKDELIQGISLVDGSHPRVCDANYCGVIKLTFRQAMERKFYGPPTAEAVARIPPDKHWWEKSIHALSMLSWPLPKRLRKPTVIKSGQEYEYVDDFAVNMRMRVPIRQQTKKRRN